MPSAVEVKIFVKGKQLSSFVHLTVQQNVLTYHTFEVSCRLDAFENFSATSDSFVVEKAKDLIGKKLKIEVCPLGKNSASGKSIVIFQGIILEIEGAKYQDAMSGEIYLRGASLDIFLDQDRHCRSYQDKSLDDIIRNVLSDYPANLFDKSEIASRKKEPLPYIVQYNETNLDFITRLAKTYGEWYLVNGSNQLYFGEPPGKKASLLHGKDLYEFSYTMRISNLNFSYSDYNYHAEESITKESKILQPKTDSYLKHTAQTAEDIFSHSEEVYYNFPLSSNNAEKEIEYAVKTDKRSRIAGLNISGGSSENCELTLGGIVKIDSISGDKAARTVNYGEYRIIAITHTCENSGNYSNTFEAVPVNAELPPSTDTRLFPECETQSAVVTNTDDPDGMGRIKVRFHWQDNKSESSWVRIITPYAGKNKGVFFIPEIGEEVLVGFEHSNAEKPYIIGSLFNGKKKPDDWITKGNYKKAIRTQSGHTIEFNDEGGSETITIYDKDKVNTIILSSSSKELKIISTGDISIQADQNIEIKAKKDIKLDAVNLDIKTSANINADASAKINMKAAQDYSMDAMNIKGKAKVKLGLEASASADIKAAMIKIG